MLAAVPIDTPKNSLVAVSSTSVPPSERIPSVKTKKIKVCRGGKSRNKFVKKNDNSGLKIYHSNLRGFDSKCISLESIISSLKPNIVTLN